MRLLQIHSTLNRLSVMIDCSIESSREQLSIYEKEVSDFENMSESDFGSYEEWQKCVDKNELTIKNIAKLEQYINDINEVGKQIDEIINNIKSKYL